MKNPSDLGFLPHHQHHPIPDDSRLCCCMGDLIIPGLLTKEMIFHVDNLIFHPKKISHLISNYKGLGEYSDSVFLK